MKNHSALFLLLVMLPCISNAAENNAKVIYVFKDDSTPGKSRTRAIAAALVNMGDLMDAPGDGCTQMIGTVKVEGVQFSQSGATLESFRFTDKNGSQWSVPTNIGQLSNAARREANSFIKVGKTYYSHIQVCGSGGFATLINLYDASISFGPK